MNDIAVQLTRVEARALTDEIRFTTEKLYALLLRAYEGQAWVALGYDSWRDYAMSEFQMSQSQAYRLLDQARVIEAIEAASTRDEVEHVDVERIGPSFAKRSFSPMGEKDQLLSTPLPSEREARELAPLLAEPEKLRATWAEANRMTGGKPTTAAVRQAREQISPRPVMPPRLAPVPPPPAPNEQEVVEAELVEEPLAAGGQGLIDALERHMPGTQADIDRSGVRARWSKNIHAIADIPLMNPEHVAAVLRDLDVSAYRLTIRQLNAWCEQLDNVLEPKGLRAIEGGRP